MYFELRFSSSGRGDLSFFPPLLVSYKYPDFKMCGIRAKDSLLEIVFCIYVHYTDHKAIKQRVDIKGGRYGGKDCTDSRETGAWGIRTGVCTFQ